MPAELFLLKLHFCYFFQPAIFRLICCMNLSCFHCVLLALSISSLACVGHGLHNWFPAFLWKRATPVIVGWFAGRTWKNDNKRYAELPKLLLNFYSIYTVYKCGRGSHNITLPPSRWKTTLYSLFRLAVFTFILHAKP